MGRGRGRENEMVKKEQEQEKKRVITKLNEKSAIAFALMLRKGENTSNIKIHFASFFL